MKNLNKSFKGGIGIILCLIISLNLKAQAPDTIWQPSVDAELRQQQPLLNFNLLSTMTMNPKSTSAQSMRGIIKFDIDFDSLPANITVTSAKIRLYTVAASHPATSKQIAAHRVVNDWTETNASWNRRTSNNWTSSGGDFAPGVTGLANALPAGEWIEIDVTSDLQAFRLDSTINKGWILKIHSEDNSGHSWTYATREYLGGIFAPQLIINYGFFLPVDYKNFTAKPIDKSVKLEWNTIKEVDNDRFEIERSLDGKIWSKIGTVDGNGFSSTTLKYLFMDDQPQKGLNYYRLKQVDFNGKYSYSEVISIALKVESVDIISTFKDYNSVSVKISSEEDQLLRISIVDMAGRLLISDEVHIKKGMNNYSYNIGTIAPGIYIITVANGEEVATFKTYLK